LGIILVRSGRMAEARAAYERAANMGLVPAMTNRGNLALIEKDHAAAGRWFALALARDPTNRAALRGTERLKEREE
jgi:Flp pilus assembly protein TadD